MEGKLNKTIVVGKLDVKRFVFENISDKGLGKYNAN
jgi:hypothetical protein